MLYLVTSISGFQKTKNETEITPLFPCLALTSQISDIPFSTKSWTSTIRHRISGSVISFAVTVVSFAIMNLSLNSDEINAHVSNDIAEYILLTI